MTRSPDVIGISRCARDVSHPHQLPLRTGLIFHDVSGHSAVGYCIRTGQVHLARPAASGKVAVLGADHDLIRARGNSRPGVDAGAAAGLDYDGAGLLEDIQIALGYAVLTSLLRTELNVELAR